MKTMEIYIRSVWKTNLVYKCNFIIGVLANIFHVISMMFIWYVVYRNNGGNIIYYTFYSKTNFNVTYLSIFFYSITVIFSIILNFMLSLIIGLVAFYLNYI